MIILVDIGHPAHVHLFKNLIWLLKKKGHNIHITARDKEIVLDLLNYYKFDYILISKSKKGLLNIGKEMIRRDYNLFNLVRKIHPDLMIAVLDPPITQIGKLLNVPTITFTDTEHAKIANIATIPFASTICTPLCYRHNLGKKQVRYNGYHELAYLHPTNFTPNPAVLAEVGLTEGDPFIIVRFVSWNASHDIGHYGIRDKDGLVKVLELYGRVLISSEGALPPELLPYQIQVSPEKIHDLLYYSVLYIGEGATMASEAAMLGTPSIFVSSLAGTMGNFIELEETYNLLYSFTDSDEALGRAVEILKDSASKEEWRIKRERLLKEKIDVTAFMVWIVENYPECLVEIKEHPEV